MGQEGKKEKREKNMRTKEIKIKKKKTGRKIETAENVKK